MDHLISGLLLGVAAALLTGTGLYLRRRASPRQTNHPSSSAVPDQPVDALPLHLAVEIRTPFFDLSEGELFQTLERALPPGYRAFPNVRLYDLFQVIAAPPPQQAALTRLRDEHIDFLIVVLDGYRPVAAIEVSGKTVDHAEQSRRDAAKNLLFRSTGLLLLRLRAEEDHTQATLEALLWAHLRPAERELV